MPDVFDPDFAAAVVTQRVADAYFSALSPGPYSGTTPTSSISGVGSLGKPGRQSNPANTGAMLSASITTGVRSAMIQANGRGFTRSANPPAVTFAQISI